MKRFSVLVFATTIVVLALSNIARGDEFEEGNRAVEKYKQDHLNMDTENRLHELEQKEQEREFDKNWKEDTSSNAFLNQNNIEDGG